MIIKEGLNAVNVVTDSWLHLDENMDLKVGDLITLSNKKKYVVVGFMDDKYVKVGPPNYKN